MFRCDKDVMFLWGVFGELNGPDANFPTRLGRGFWQFGACTAVAHLVMDRSSNDPVRYESLSKVAGRDASPRIW